MGTAEFAFLVIGLLVGGTIGAFVTAIARARPATREVRVTMTRDAQARRHPATLASTVPIDRSGAFGGPADRTAVPTAPAGWQLVAPEAQPVPVLPSGMPAPVPGAVPTPASVLAAPTARPATRLPENAVGIAIDAGRAQAPATPAMAVAGTAAGSGAGTTGGDALLGAIPTWGRIGEPDRPMAVARRSAGSADAAGGAGAAGITPGGMAAQDTGAGGGTRAGSLIAGGPIATASRAGSSAGGTESAASAGGPSNRPGTERCADERRIADERCSIAQAARDHATEIAGAVRASRLEYDAHWSRIEQSEAIRDPRRVRDAKDAAQHAFRAAHAAARTPDEAESAARDWLHEINRINHATRDAIRELERSRTLVTELAARLDRLALEADAARIAAETAEVACREAREVVVRCESGPEPVASVPVPPAAPAPGGPGPGWSDRPPVIFRLLQGDRAALEQLATTLGGDDPSERRRWQLRIADLVDAIIARAVEAAYLDFPDDHRFWGPFTREQSRDIVGALASLGFRFDGLGGWVDERVPSQRDLSLAVGYAGLDPMRIRFWPTEPELQDLYRTAFVSADEWIAGAAGDLTLGEMIDALGRRADDLADLWNEWARVRPLLLGD